MTHEPFLIIAAGEVFEPRDVEFALAFVGTVLGAAAGSVARDAIVRRARRRWDRADLGVLVANLVAVLVVGLATALPDRAHGLVVLGFAGGLSTWSSLAVDVAGMLRERRFARVALHLPVGFVAAAAIFVVARSLVGGGAT